MTNFNIEQGEILLIDKPYEWTSFDVVRKVRNTFKIKKVGHAGTLDPLATGLLIVCVGKATKKIQFIQAEQKEYICEMTVGATTPTYDLESEIDNTFETSHITPSLLEATKAKFIGDIQQTPPAHSAVKVNGKRAYELARKGLEVDIKAKTVNIEEIEILDVTLPKVKFRVTCSKGTYIRSLVNDWGKELNSGAHMTALVRTKIGKNLLEKAWQLDDLIEEIKTYRESLP